MDGDGNINYEEFVGTVFKGVSILYQYLIHAFSLVFQSDFYFYIEVFLVNPKRSYKIYNLCTVCIYWIQLLGMNSMFYCYITAIRRIQAGKIKG